jgi:hypothetical protein
MFRCWNVHHGRYIVARRKSAAGTEKYIKALAPEEVQLLGNYGEAGGLGQVQRVVADEVACVEQVLHLGSAKTGLTTCDHLMLAE